MAFSATLMSPNRRMFWNVRAMPARARRLGANAVMSWPPSRMRPALGRVRPDTRLNSVVLPAPFGPISACTPPCAISRSTASTATSPA